MHRFPVRVGKGDYIVQGEIIMKKIKVCVGMDADGQLIIKHINEVFTKKGRYRNEG